jgi:hypothetical protein
LISRAAALAVLAGALLAPLGAQAQTGCSLQSQNTLLTEFSDSAGAGAITPAVLRNFICSTIIAPDTTVPWTVQGPITFNGAVTFASSSSISSLVNLSITGLLTVGPTSGNKLTVNGGATSGTGIDIAATGSGAIEFTTPVQMGASGNGLTVSNGLLVNGRIENFAGNASIPTYSFQTDLTTGMYLPASGQLGFSAGATDVLDYGTTNSNEWTFSAPVVISAGGTGLTVANGLVLQGRLETATGSAAVPSISFASDLTSGLYLPGTGELGFTAASGAVADYGKTNSGAWTFPTPVYLTDSANVVGNLNLGVSGSSAGALVFNNATSGSIAIHPPTGALSNPTLILPDVSSTLATLAAQTFTGTQTEPDASTFALGGLTLATAVTFASSTTGVTSQSYTNGPCTTSATTAQWIPVKITGQSGTWYVPACH